MKMSACIVLHKSISQYLHARAKKLVKKAVFCSFCLIRLATGLGKIDTSIKYLVQRYSRGQHLMVNKVNSASLYNKIFFFIFRTCKAFKVLDVAQSLKSFYLTALTCCSNNFS